MKMAFDPAPKTTLAKYDEQTYRNVKTARLLTTCGVSSSLLCEPEKRRRAVTIEMLAVTANVQKSIGSNAAVDCENRIPTNPPSSGGSTRIRHPAIFAPRFRVFVLCLPTK